MPIDSYALPREKVQPEELGGALAALAYKTTTPEMFDPTATLLAGGLKLTVSGPLQCSGGRPRVASETARR
jgi:hypothetical protein